ncbi:YaaR family protein [Geotalea sp. SG265]|uniref:YaaR family protein n=1 Tax=Geotalea sp. SG265 TaxID=2922867 RepID=UPI001FAF3CFB|nr:YaaR family protein [Geotalea sp. SG265]
MRINEKSGSRQIEKRTKGSSASKAGGAAGSPFARKLGMISRDADDYAGQLQELKEEIDLAGDSLEQEPTIVNFKRFRSLISAFAKKVTSEAYRLEIAGSPGQRCHEVVTVIDREADALYHLIMQEQKNHIKITAQIMKIKGLVVDFLL